MKFVSRKRRRLTDEHRSAIRQINLGTKGTDHRAIGRFGKGLKSVFAWCEAFFIIASAAIVSPEVV